MPPSNCMVSCLFDPLQRRGPSIQGLRLQGKQVRTPSASDVVRFIEEFLEKPRIAEVYNLGGGKQNSCSILEAFALAEKFSGKPQNYLVLEESRIGDHVCYYSNLRRIRAHYPNWGSACHCSPCSKKLLKPGILAFVLHDEKADEPA